MQSMVQLPLGVRVMNRRKKTRGIMIPRLRSCKGMIPSPNRFQFRFIEIYRNKLPTLQDNIREEKVPVQIMSVNVPLVFESPDLALPICRA